MATSHYQNAQLRSTGWVIALRWCYVPLAFLLGVVSVGGIGAPNTTGPLVVALLLALIGNGFFFLHYRKLASIGLAYENMGIFTVAQIGLDLSYFFIVLLCSGGGVGSTGNMFFFLPIIISIFTFGARGALIVATLSGFFTLFAALYSSGMFAPLYIGIAVLPTNLDSSVIVLESVTIFCIYLLTAFFGGYALKFLRTRDILRLEQITNVAHQLRTPLSAIKWSTKMLLDEDAGKNTAEQARLLTKSFALSERMVTLVNDMLAAGRVESGKFVYHFSFVQFEELIQEMIGHVLPIATEKDIQIAFTSPEAPLPPWQVDPGKIRDVLQNLLDNAIKYTKRGGMITVGLKVEEGHLHLSVKDNGIGIPDDVKSQIFSRFFRAPNAIAVETNGSGLGLSIAQSIIQRHGGKIWFDNVPGGGTVFHVLLPFRH